MDGPYRKSFWAATMFRCNPRADELGWYQPSGRRTCFNRVNFAPSCVRVSQQRHVLGGGLEPPCLSAYAPQTYVSAISPPERCTFAWAEIAANPNLPQPEFSKSLA